MTKQPRQPCRECGRILQMKRNSDVCHTCRVRLRPAVSRECERCDVIFTTRDERDMCWPCMEATRPARQQERARRDQVRQRLRATTPTGELAWLMSKKPQGELYNR